MRSAIAALIVFTTVAHADQPTANKIAEGKEHYRQGTQLYDIGKYAEAAAEYETAFRLTDRAGLLFNMGQAYRLAGDAKKAVAAYQGFLRREPNSPQRAEVDSNIAELEKKIQEDEAREAVAKEAADRSAADQAAAERAAAEKAASEKLVAAQKPAGPAKHKTKPWVWAVVGVAAALVVGTAVGLGVGLTTTDKPLNPSFGTATLQKVNP
jgi:tetratricopeptide (TPR) repeat protein